MALVLADRVLETTTTTGSGTITLAGAEPGYQSFAVIGNGNETYYTIAGDTQWEVGIGTYTSSGTTLSRDTVLSSSASGAKVGFSAGQKKVFVTYPSEKSVNFGVSGNISVSSGVITDVGYPSADSDAATKLYVDNMTSAALHIHEAVVLTTPAGSGRNDNYNNGTAGVSATLTATANGTLVIDSTVAQAAQRVLIKDCDDQAENGIYVVTTVGTVSTPYVMTRASDADTYGEGGSDSLDLGSYFFTTGGTTQKGAAYVCNTPGVIVFGSTAITFAEFSQAQVYSAGNGISITLGSIALNTPVTVASGGTGLTTSPANGQLLIGNGSNYTLSTLTAGSGVSITNSAGSITLSATGLGGTVTAVTATGPLASSGGTTPDISIANSTGTGSVVLDQGATISSATITAAVSASITTITGSSANITTVTGTTAGFSSANITQLGSTSATIATLSGTNVTYSSGTVSQLAATSATIASVSGTNVTYSNGNFTSATVTTISGTTATYTSATVTNLAVTSVTISSLSLTNLAAASATITTGNLTFSSTAQRITGDFSNATAANRLLFQTSTTNGNSFVGAMPNGTGTFGAYIAYNGSDPVNSSSLLQGITSTDARLVSTFAGTGSYLPLTFYTGGSERVRIDTSGNVGIGTASPGVKLDLGTDVTAQKLFVFRSSNSKAGFGVQSGDFRSFAPSDAAMTFGQISVSDGTTYTERMRIDSSGNVGIGSASPSEKLQVGGNAYLNVGKYIANRSGAAGVTTASGLELQIDGSTQCGIYTPTSSAMALYTGGSERIRVNSSGNVGIGTASPSTALQVSGTITTTGLTVSNTIVGSINGNAATVTNGLYTTGNQTITARTIQQGSQTATMLTATGSLGGFELQSAGASAAAFMTFHRPGAYASYFGIDTDNQFAVGGWSAGAGLAAMKIGTLGVGTPASGTGGEIRATNNITAYYSDARLKDFKGKIGDALYKVSQLNGYYYTENEKAEEFGFNNKELQVGVSAQEVKAILPEVIAPAPFDMDAENKSKSGEDYMTVRYEKLVPLLIEAIKELKAEVEALKAGK